MGKPLAVDWNHARTLFSRGFSYREIAERMGLKSSTVSMRSLREDWASNTKPARGEKKRGDLRTRTANWVERTLSNLEDTLDAIERLRRPKTLDGLADYEALVTAHVKRGQSILGLDKPGVSVAINVGIVGLGAVLPDVLPLEVQPGAGERVLPSACGPLDLSAEGHGDRDPGSHLGQDRAAGDLGHDQAAAIRAGEVASASGVRHSG